MVTERIYYYLFTSIKFNGWSKNQQLNFMLVLLILLLK